MRTDACFYRRVGAWDDFVWDSMQADFPPAGLVQLRPAFNSLV